MSAEELAELKRLAEAATPGPWEVRWDGEEPWDIPDGAELPDEITVGAGLYLESGGRYWSSADLILERDVSGDMEDEVAMNAATADYIAAADPQTMIALLDERERFEKDYPCDGGCSYGDGPQEECSRHGRKPAEIWQIVADIAKERDALQARIDAALAYIDDPGNWGAYDGRRRLLHDLLSTPAENGEEQ